MATAAILFGTVSFAYTFKGLFNTMWHGYEERIESQMAEDLD